MICSNKKKASTSTNQNNKKKKITNSFFEFLRAAKHSSFPANITQTEVNSESAGAYFQWWISTH